MWLDFNNFNMMQFSPDEISDIKNHYWSKGFFIGMCASLAGIILAGIITGII